MVTSTGIDGIAAIKARVIVLVLFIEFQGAAC